jgi:hypothetical protein
MHAIGDGLVEKGVEKGMNGGGGKVHDDEVLREMEECMCMAERYETEMY